MSSPPVFTLAQLLQVQDLDGIRARYLASLQGAGFPALSTWVPKDGVEMAHVNQVASFLANDIAADLPAMVAGGFLGKAADIGASAALHLLGETEYLLPFDPATSTSLNFDLSCVAGAGPYTFNPGDVQIIALATGNHYVNATGGTVPLGGTITLNFVAAAPGSSHNDDPMTSKFALMTSFAGVTATPSSPPFTPVLQTGSSTGRVVPLAAAEPHDWIARIDVTGDPGTAVWSLQTDGGSFVSQGVMLATAVAGDLTVEFILGAGSPSSFIAGDTFTFTAPGGAAYVQGSDAESDQAYAARCRGRWRTLSPNPTEGLYVFWARQAVPQASRLSLGVDPDVPGRVLMIAADSAGPLDPSAIAAINSFIRPRLSALEGFNATPAKALQINATGNVLAPGPTLLAVQQAADAAWIAYLGQVAIGGQVLVFDLEGILEDAGAISSGVEVGAALALNLGGDVSLGSSQVPIRGASLADSLKWITG